MSLPAPLDQLPPETMVSVGYLRSLDFTGDPEIITTTQASERWSYSPDTWSGWAKAGKIAGAWQDGEGGIWRLPFESCAAHVERVRSEAQATRQRRRRPWGREEAQAERVRPEGLPERKVLPLRSASVGDGARGHAKPESGGLAREGRANRAAGDR